MKRNQISIFPSLFEPEAFVGMPTTRYQGSKRKVLKELQGVFSKLDFNTCLDAFGGTGSVSHLLRNMKKTVTYSDILPFNVLNAQALFSGGQIRLQQENIREIFEMKSGKSYLQHVRDFYHDIYFTDEENEQIDVVTQNILELEDEVMKSEAFYCLFQTLISKRPYNLFHRANLHIRTKDVERSFGNKVTWDRTLFDHMSKFQNELLQYKASTQVAPVRVVRRDAFEPCVDKYDLVYIDTPYAKSEGNQESNYFNFYHFLDALVAYPSIPTTINTEYAHRPFYSPNTKWYQGNDIVEGFNKLFERFKESILVISYRSDGYPSVEGLEKILRDQGRQVTVDEFIDYRYVLAKEKRDSKEVVILAR